MSITLVEEVESREIKEKLHNERMVEAIVLTVYVESKWMGRWGKKGVRRGDRLEKNKKYIKKLEKVGKNICFICENGVYYRM